MMPSGPGRVPPGAGEGSARSQGGPEPTTLAVSDELACSQGGAELTTLAADAGGASAQPRSGLESTPPGAGGRSAQLSCEPVATPASDLSAALSAARAGAGTLTVSGGANTGRTVVISEPEAETGCSVAKPSRR